MLKPSEALDDIYQQFSALRMRLQGEIDKIVEELKTPSRNREALIVAACAQIDALVRDYQIFVAQVNATRVQEESHAESHQDLITKRREWGPATAQTNLFRSELNRWYEMKALVNAQTKMRRTKLYVDGAKLPAPAQAQMLASDDVFNWLHQMLNTAPQSDAAHEKGCFPDIGLSNYDFHAHMHAAYRVALAQRRENPARFLDVGCGVGLKVYSALRYFGECYGFDFDPAYVAAGKRFLAMDGAAKAGIFEQDALTFDDYHAFDVIYFYRPMSDDTLLHALEQRIAETAREGTILIAPYINFSERHAELECGRVSGAVYLAKSPQKKADAIRRKAERTGVFIAKSQPVAPASVWTPLERVSHANGYDLPHHHKRPTY